MKNHPILEACRFGPLKSNRQTRIPAKGTICGGLFPNMFFGGQICNLVQITTENEHGNGKKTEFESMYLKKKKKCCCSIEMLVLGGI